PAPETGARRPASPGVVWGCRRHRAALTKTGGWGNERRRQRDKGNRGIGGYDGDPAGPAGRLGRRRGGRRGEPVGGGRRSGDPGRSGSSDERRGPAADEEPAVRHHQPEDADRGDGQRESPMALSG